MSIQPNELRIGNLLLFNRQSDDGDYILRVTQIKENGYYAEGDEVYPTRHEFGEISGIPLTPEWMEKLGFVAEEMRSIKVHFTYGGESLTTNQPALKYYIPGKQAFELRQSEGAWREQLYGRIVLHVHQLMNLFHALTGEELTVKEMA